MTKKPVKVAKRKTATSQCCIIGTKPKGLGAAMFPAHVVFTFEVTDDGVEVTGFREVATPGATGTRLALWANTAIPKAAAKQAKREILDEYGDRWTLTVTDVKA